MKTAKIKVVSGDEWVRSVFTDGGCSCCCCCFRLRRWRGRHRFIDRHGTLRHSAASSPHGWMVRVSLMTVHCSGCQQMCAGTVRVVLHFMMQVWCISRAILTLLQANTVTAHECGSPVYPCHYSRSHQTLRTQFIRFHFREWHSLCVLVWNARKQKTVWLELMLPVPAAEQVFKTDMSQWLR